MVERQRQWKKNRIEQENRWLRDRDSGMKQDRKGKQMVERDYKKKRRERAERKNKKGLIKYFG